MWRLLDSQDYLIVLVVAISISLPCFCTNVSIVEKTRPHVVNVGAIFAYNSTIGKVAKTAIELAVKDVNNNQALLNGTKLVLTRVDSRCNVFVGTGEGTYTLKEAGTSP